MTYDAPEHRDLALGNAVSPTDGQVVLASAPDDLVKRVTSQAKRRQRQQRLIAWCEARGVLPTLAELEAERDRRDRDRIVKKLMAPHWKTRDDRGAGVQS